VPKEKMSMSLFFVAFLSTLFLAANAQMTEWQFIMYAVNSSDFVVDTLPAISGAFFTSDIGALGQIISFGSGLSASIGYNLYNLTTPMTMTFAVCVRDATVMANSSLLAFYNAVVTNACMIKVVDTVDGSRSTGGGSVTVQRVIVSGTVDDYMNTIGDSDDITIDFGVFVNAPVANQVMMINLRGSAPAMFAI
jgi:hypothetical protein